MAARAFYGLTGWFFLVAIITRSANTGTAFPFPSDKLAAPSNSIDRSAASFSNPIDTNRQPMPFVLRATPLDVRKGYAFPTDP